MGEVLLIEVTVAEQRWQERFALAGRASAAVIAARSWSSCCSDRVAEMNWSLIMSVTAGEGGNGGLPSNMSAALRKAPIVALVAAAWAFRASTHCAACRVFQ